MELTNTLDMALPEYQAPLTLPAVCDLLPSPVQYRHAVINTFVHVHNSVRKVCTLVFEKRILRFKILEFPLYISAERE